MARSPAHQPSKLVGVHHPVMDDPQKRLAFEDDDLDNIGRAFDQIEQDDGIADILNSALHESACRKLAPVAQERHYNCKVKSL